MKEWNELPVEIQEKVKERHLEQHGRFLNLAFNDACVTWFVFRDTIEGDDFWRSVLVGDNHELFSKRYPKLQQPA